MSFAYLHTNINLNYELFIPNINPTMSFSYPIMSIKKIFTHSYKHGNIPLGVILWMKIS